MRPIVELDGQVAKAQWVFEVPLRDWSNDSAFGAFDRGVVISLTPLTGGSVELLWRFFVKSTRWTMSYRRIHGVLDFTSLGEMDTVDLKLRNG